MNALLDVYQALFKNEVALSLQYRIQVVLWLLFGVVQPVMYLVIWSTVAQAKGGAVGGYTAHEFAAYFIVLTMVNHVTFTWVMFEFEFQVRQGQLSPRLLRPVDPIHGFIAANVTYKVLTLVIMLPVVALLSVLFQPEYHTPPWALVALVPVLALAFAIRFLLEWSLALLAFWATRIMAFNDAFNLVWMFMSGFIAPLSLFPPALQVAATILPFRWSVGFPVELLLGRLTPPEVGQGLAAQTIWLAVAVAIWKLTWRAGIRRYSAVGA